jgi:hypothetical protein
MQADQPEAAVGQDAMGTGGGNIGVGQAPVPGEQGFPTGGGPQPQQGQPQQGGGQGIPPQLMALLQASGQ